MEDFITLACGSGGKATHKLINDVFYKYFANDLLLEAGDSAVFNVKGGCMSFTTDSYVVSPIFFKGGNIGKLSICGTVNDLAVSGACPKYISCGFIIEEGFSISELLTIAKSMAETAKEAGVSIVTGDTKVVQKGSADKIFINTSGIGFIRGGVELSKKYIRNGDKVILSGTIGDHGTAILIEREKLKVQSTIKSDCAPLNLLLEPVIKAFPDKIRVMRDPTRGGVATALNELINGTGLSIRLNEDTLPVHEEVKGVCELLGMDPLYMANEGKVLLIVDASYADKIVDVLKTNPYGRDAAIIGTVCDSFADKVFLSTLAGGNRIIDVLVSDQLPRIC
jgi:hydrogenase expression/formation protein HypE